jgi:hypothetical protein
MALVVTSLAGDCTLNARQIKLTAFTNPSVGAIGANTMALVDGEVMRITDATLSPSVSVTRGDSLGVGASVASAHKALAPVVYGLTSDFTQTVTTDGIAGATVISYSVSGAITVPVVDQTIYLTKAGVAVMTLAGPASDQTNTVKIISLTANAHTVTYTAGFYQNTTSSDVLTFPATSGAAFTFQAKNGVWNAIATADDGALLG